MHQEQFKSLCVWLTEDCAHVCLSLCGSHYVPSHTFLCAYVHLFVVCCADALLVSSVCVCVWYSLQEDIESMQKELEGWRTENADHADALRREERCAVKKGQCIDHCMLCWCT